MALDYLDFDFSGDADGGGSFEAMASVPATHWPALQAQVVQVLDWAVRAFGAPAAVDEGGEWDYALHGVRESSTPLVVVYAPGARELQLRAGADDPARMTLTLTLSGTEAFCASFRQAFALP